MKYIDADKLIAEIERRIKENEVLPHRYIRLDEDKQLLSFITSLQREQPEVDVVSTAKVFLDALSKTPYNNKPITDAQIIIKQLLLFFENPKGYNPNAITEQTEVNLEKEVEKQIRSTFYDLDGIAIMGTSKYASVEDMEYIARHFYELGLNARKEK